MGESCLAIVPYAPHPLIALIREFLGYTVEDTTSVEDESYLRSLDPKDWKSQDHYAVLGLQQSRHQASADDIRKAYRRMILKHHPDKRRVHGENVEDESHDYFSCITIAYEILGNPTKRHAYDSVDPLSVDDSVPSLSEIKADYFGTLNRFFTRKARWSKRQPVPSIGKADAHIDEVHRFYDFWENYDTTRDYSYLDEEDKEKGEDRESRRAIERQNRADRARRRADELRSIRQVVEMAKTNDPRLLAAAKALRDAKAAKRQARLDAIREKREAEEKQARLEAEQQAAAREASEERHRAEAERLRKEREQTRQQAKRERRRLRNLVVDQYQYFLNSASDTSDTSVQHVSVLADMDLLCQRLSNMQLQGLNDQLESAESVGAAHALFSDKVSKVREEIQAPGPQPISTSNAQSDSLATPPSLKFDPVTIQTLIKAVNLMPAGTPKRWEAIAAYINQHVPGASISSKEALKQAKALSHDNSNIRKEVNERAFDSFSHSVRETDAVKHVAITTQLEADVPRPWTVIEQRALEQALRSCPPRPSDGSDTDRWQRIADMVGTRTKRECMLRCKELSDQVKAKKASLAANKPPNGSAAGVKSSVPK